MQQSCPCLRWVFCSRHVHKPSVPCLVHQSLKKKAMAWWRLGQCRLLCAPFFPIHGMALGRLVRNKPPLILCLGAVGPGDKVYRSVPTTQCAEATAERPEPAKGRPKGLYEWQKNLYLGKWAAHMRICNASNLNQLTCSWGRRVWQESLYLGERSRSQKANKQGKTQHKTGQVTSQKKYPKEEGHVSRTLVCSQGAFPPKFHLSGRARADVLWVHGGTGPRRWFLVVQGGLLY